MFSRSGSGCRDKTMNRFSVPTVLSNARRDFGGIVYGRQPSILLLPSSISAEGNIGFHVPLDPWLMMYRYPAAFASTLKRILSPAWNTVSTGTSVGVLSAASFKTVYRNPRGGAPLAGIG